MHMRKQDNSQAKDIRGPCKIFQRWYIKNEVPRLKCENEERNIQEKMFDSKLIAGKFRLVQEMMYGTCK